MGDGIDHESAAGIIQPRFGTAPLAFDHGIDIIEDMPSDRDPNPGWRMHNLSRCFSDKLKTHDLMRGIGHEIKPVEHAFPFPVV